MRIFLLCWQISEQFVDTGEKTAGRYGDAELKVLRFSLGVTKMDNIRNEYIGGTAQVGCLERKHEKQD